MARTVFCDNALKLGKVIIANEIQEPVDRTPTLSGFSVGDVTLDYDDITDITAAGTLRIEIDSEGTPDTFKYSLDGGDTDHATGISCSTDYVVLDHGFKVKFSKTTGFSTGDYADFEYYQYATDMEQDFSDDFTRYPEIVPPEYQPENVNTQENHATGSDYPRDVEFAGRASTMPYRLAQGDVEAAGFFWAWTNNGYFAFDSDTDMLSVIGGYDHRRRMDTRCVGVRLGRNMAYHRMYGMTPQQVQMSFNGESGNFMDLNTTLLGTGKRDISPFDRDKTFSDVAYTATSCSLDTAPYDGLQSIRTIVWIDANGVEFYLNPTSVDGTTLYYTSPAAAHSVSSGNGTLHVTYQTTTDLASGWMSEIETAVDPEHTAVKTSHIQEVSVGGSVSTADTWSHTGGKRLECTFADISFTLDPKVVKKSCPDGSTGKHSNIFYSGGEMLTVAFSQDLFDMLPEYWVENEVEFPLYFKATLEEVTDNQGVAKSIEVFIPAMKITQAAITDRDGRIGTQLTPIVLYNGTDYPWRVNFIGDWPTNQMWGKLS